MIGTVKATTDSMAEMMALKWEQVDAIVKQIKGELSYADKEFEELNKIVLEKLKHLEQLIDDPDQVGRDEAIDELVERIETGYADISLSCPDHCLYEWDESSEPDESVEPVLEPSREKEICYLNEKDGPGLEDQQPQNSLLKRAHENLEELKKRAHMKFDSVLESLKAAKNEANERMRYQEEKRGRAEIKLRSIQESLKDLLKARLSHSRVQSSMPNYIYEPQIQMQINWGANLLDIKSWPALLNYVIHMKDARLRERDLLMCQRHLI